MFFKDEDYQFLSNMYPISIKIKTGQVFSCVESAYVAHKTYPIELKCLTLNGYEAKRFGRKLKLRQDWDIIKIPIMRELLQIKFANPLLLLKLKSIKEEIVEDNWWKDTFWGRCDGVGENHLGKLLMEIRDNS